MCSREPMLLRTVIFRGLFLFQHKELGGAAEEANKWLAVPKCLANTMGARDSVFHSAHDPSPRLVRLVRICRNLAVSRKPVSSCWFRLN
jgi:hypothetical protein